MSTDTLHSNGQPDKDRLSRNEQDNIQDDETWQYLADVVPGITLDLETFRENREARPLYVYSNDETKDLAAVHELFDMTGVNPEAGRSVEGKVTIRVAPIVAQRIEDHLVANHGLSLGEEFAESRLLREVEFTEFDMPDGAYLQGLRIYTYTPKEGQPEGAVQEYDTVPHVAYIAVGRSAFGAPSAT